MYICQHCDHSSSIKLGKCPSCGAYGGFIIDENKRKVSKKSKTGQALTEKKDKQSKTYVVDHREMQRVFQKGIKQAGVYLLGGEPGIGKSTIMLQIIHELYLHNPHLKIAYLSAEEHASHVKERYERLFPDANGLPFNIYQASQVEDIVKTAEENQYDCMIVDSIQTIQSAQTESVAGSPNQVRQSSEQLVQMAKSNDCTLFVIGHVTKGGEIAGPKYLEHIVDVVLYLEGDKDGQLRFLRCKKNRFGSADDVAIFEMTLFGLQPVYDIKERIIKQMSTTPGSVLSIARDNGRPVLVQVEALLNKSYGKFPSRRVIGVDHKRVDLIIAILEKYCKLKLQFADIYINIPGERKFNDSGLDLAIAAAIMSQYNNQTVDKTKIFLGEIGLSGKVSSSRHHSKRAKDYEKDFDLIDHNSIKHIVELQNQI